MDFKIFYLSLARVPFPFNGGKTNSRAQSRIIIGVTGNNITKLLISVVLCN